MVLYLYRQYSAVVFSGQLGSKEVKSFTAGTVSVKNVEGENLIYFSGDVGKSVRLKELTKNKLVVIEKDVVNRQVVEIEKVYNKK